MKKTIFILFALFVAACGDKGGDSPAGGQVANTPLDTSCINGSVNCNNSVYNQNQQYGWQSYPGFRPGYNYVAYFQNNGLCSCPVGSRPTYNSYSGLGCVRDYYIQSMVSFSFYWQIGYSSYNPYYATYGYPSSNATGYANDYPTNLTQVSNISGYPQNHTSCYNELIQSCHIDQVNSCGAGATCRVTASASRLGICVRN